MTPNYQGSHQIPSYAGAQRARSSSSADLNVRHDGV